MKTFNHVLVTGGCGFIGSNFIKFLFNNPEFQGSIVNIDKLTYAGKKENVSNAYVHACMYACMAVRVVPRLRGGKRIRACEKILHQTHIYVCVYGCPHIHT
jgi:dTDP-D-glucose 4,6-dehydratase